jgi:hypothetical protein
MNRKHNNIVYSKQPSYTNKEKQKGGRKYNRILTPEEINSKAMSKRNSKAMLKDLEQIKKNSIAENIIVKLIMCYIKVIH